jgi:hypothetical protein
VPEQRVQDDKNDLEQRNGQRMIAAASSVEQDSPAPPNIAQRIGVRNVAAGLRRSANGRVRPGSTHEGRFDLVLVRAGDRIPRRA